jgi:hypothetical protein
LRHAAHDVAFQDGGHGRRDEGLGAPIDTAIDEGVEIIGEVGKADRTLAGGFGIHARAGKGNCRRLDHADTHQRGFRKRKGFIWQKGDVSCHAVNLSWEFRLGIQSIIKTCRCFVNLRKIPPRAVYPPPGARYILAERKPTGARMHDQAP